MAIGSTNKSIIKSLIETVKHKLELPKLYDALRKMHDDLNKTYEALFEGPLPEVSGENLDLSNIDKDNLPDFIAYIDQLNQFEESQELVGEGLSLRIQFDDGSIIGDKYLRVKQPADGHSLFSANLDFDGTDYLTDDGDGSGFEAIDALLQLRQQIAGIDYLPLKVDADQIIQLGNPLSVINAVADDVVLKHEALIRAADSTNLLTFPLIGLDLNDLVQLGTNPVGATTGEGNVAIPRVLTADLPTAGPTRNGIILIDQTAGRLCYYVNNLRYYIPIGTPF